MLFFLSCDEVLHSVGSSIAEEAASLLVCLPFTLSILFLSSSAVVCRSLHPRSPPCSEGGPRVPHKSLHTPFLSSASESSLLIHPTRRLLPQRLLSSSSSPHHTLLAHIHDTQLRGTVEVDEGEFKEVVADCGCRPRDRPNSLAPTHSSSYVWRVETAYNELRGRFQ